MFRFTRVVGGVLLSSVLSCGGETQTDESVAASAQAIDMNQSLVIRQVGKSTILPESSYIELYNRSDDVISIYGLSVHILVPGMTAWGFAPPAIIPDVLLQPKQSFLLAYPGGPAAPSADLVWPTLPGRLPAFDIKGTVAVAVGTARLNCPYVSSAGRHACNAASLERIVDMVGWADPRVNIVSEGRSVTSKLIPALHRKLLGAQDTNDNSTDFEVGPALLRNRNWCTSPPPDDGDACTIESCNFVTGIAAHTTVQNPLAAAVIDQTVPTSFVAQTKPLYYGQNPSQFPTAPTDIDQKRVSVIRGRALNDAGAPLACVKVSVVDQPNVGTTRTDGEGYYNIALNGGGPTTVRLEFAGSISVDRQVNVGWNQYAVAQDARLLPFGATSAISSSQLSVAAGATETDANGTRRPQVMFPAGTTATVEGESVPRTNYNVQIKEFTNRTKYSRDGMPASLPYQSAFTYAVNLSVQGAENKKVTFNKSIAFYVENFLGFPNGQAVPVGYYNTATARWEAEPNGRIIRITSITNGVANLDIDSIPNDVDDPLELGIGAEERAKLAQLYPTIPAGGKKLWRFTANHFSAWDINWAWGPPPDAEAPTNPPPPKVTPEEPDPCRRGSLIGCATQSLRERVPLAGVDSALWYASARQSGAQRALRIPLTGSSLPNGLKAIELEIEVGGRKFKPAIAMPLATQLPLVHNFVWDGTDFAGRELFGAQSATIRIGYTYAGSYEQPGQFGDSGDGIPITVATDRFEATLWQTQQVVIGQLNASQSGLGGWSIGDHHALDPRTGIVYLGTGVEERRPVAFGAIAGTGVAGQGGENIAAAGSPIQISASSRIAVGPDGAVYFTEPTLHRVRRITPAGLVSTFAGGGNPNAAAPYGDGNVALGASLKEPKGVAVGPDGTVYVADSGHSRVRAVAQNGIITTVAGGGATLFNWDAEQPALSTLVPAPADLVVTPDNSIYYVSGNNVLRVRNGSISAIGHNGFGHEGLAVSAAGDIYLSAGGLHFLEMYPARYRWNGPGSLAQILTSSSAGSPPWGDGGPLGSASVLSPAGLAFGRDGLLYFADSGHGLIRRVNAAGLVDSVTTATQATSPIALAFDGSGNLYVLDLGGQRIIGVGRTLDIDVVSSDGRAVFQFDAVGRHLRTIDRRTGVLRRAFRYDSAGYLIGVSDRELTDAARQEVRIERNLQNVATAIVSPFNQRTLLDVQNGDLKSVTGPDNSLYSFDYTSGRLLRRFSDPEINAQGKAPYEFTFVGGRLAQDKDPLGHTQTLVASDVAGGQRVTRTDQASRVSTIDTVFPNEGSVERTHTGTNLLVASTRRRLDSSFTYMAPNGQGYSWTGSSPGGTRIFRRSEFGVSGGLAAQQVDREVRYEGLLGPMREIVRTRTPTLSNPLDPRSVTSFVDSVSINGRPPTSVVYSAATKTFTMTSPEGRKTTRTIDGVGRTVGFQVDGFSPLAIHYRTDNGLMDDMVYSDGATTRTYKATYSSGYVTAIDALLNGALKARRVFERDAFGRRTAVWAGIVSNGVSTHSEQLGDFSFDLNGNLTGVNTDKLGYTLLNQLKEYQAPPLAGRPAAEVATSTFGFKNDRQPGTDEFPDPGSSVVRQYDSAGRLSTILSSTAASSKLTSYEYFLYNGDAPGQLKKIVGPYGVDLAFSYSGSLLKSEAWTGSVVGSVTKSYDAELALSKEVVAGRTGSASLVRGYDNDKLATCVSPTICTPAGSDALKIERFSNNALIKTVSLGQITETYRYNSFGELAQKTSTYNGAPLLDLTYDVSGSPRDVLGRVGRFSEKVGAAPVSSYDYKYDHAGALTDVLSGGATLEHYSYDSAFGHNRSGAITSAGAVTNIEIDSRNRLKRYGNWKFSYTEKGDVKTKEDATTSTVLATLSYDSAGNLTAVAVPGKSISYVVDGRGRRVARTVGGVSRQWIYRDALHPVAELDTNGALISTFVYGTSSHVPDFMIRGGKTYRILSDQLGSPRMVVNVADAADVPFRARYSAFGEATITATAPATADFIPFGFAGGLYDSDTGLLHFGARDYDPRTGRWMSRDPALFGGGQVNLYAYVHNDPINRMDPWGLGEGAGKDTVKTIAKWFLPPPLDKLADLADLCAQHPEACATAATTGMRVGTVGAIGIAVASMFGGEPGEVNMDDQCREEEMFGPPPPPEAPLMSIPETEETMSLPILFVEE